MLTRDLQISPKFAYFLNRQGMLDALIIAYQTFREQQNFPFEIKEKRIAVQAVFKGLCELYASNESFKKNPFNSKDIFKEANEIVNELWEEKEKLWNKRPETESGKMVQELINEEKKKIENNNKDKKTYIIDVKGNKIQPDFHGECVAKSKTKAYKILLEKYPGLAKSQKTSVIKLIKLK